jgi:hypothetical protein
VFAAAIVLVAATAGVVWAHTAEQRARLTGGSVVPGPGDGDGSGRAVIKSAPEANTVCYKLVFKGIGRATSAHIHEAPKGESAPKELMLFSSKRGRRSPVEGCRHDISAAEIEDMHDNPANHYVDLHSKSRPNGALRGQLRNVD